MSTPTQWTASHILSLAPDAASAKAGQTLASLRKWQSLGRSDQAIWGECQGSASKPYQTQVELHEPAFRCSCPSRKFPCKHALALLLLMSGNPDAFTGGTPPPWVEEWLRGRAAKAEKRAEQPAAPPAKSGSSSARRATDRVGRVAAGMDELALWQRDLLRRGIASAQSQPHSFWEGPAARMVDAQAPGVARRVRAMRGIVASGQGWQERLLDHMARLHLLVEGFKRLDALPPEIQADIRTAIGWNQSQDELLQLPGQLDRWLVLGQREFEDEGLRTRRTWLWGQQHGAPALILDFAPAHQRLEKSYVTGMAIEAELVFFPSAAPLRALVKRRQGSVQPFVELGDGVGLDGLAGQYADALARNPWVEQFPALLGGVMPARDGERWLLHDTAGRALPLRASTDACWAMLALGGGQPIDVFAEWNGDKLRPLSAWSQGQFLPLHGDQQ